MDSIKRMNAALSYIEENLDNEIDLQEVARIAVCSEYHFQRMFSFLAGVPLAEYIRRRRLSMAGFDLVNSELRVIDLALKYGYNSPDAFTRAFQSYHGVTPSEARKNSTLLKASPKMSFQLTIHGGNEMKYRLEEKDAFRIVGIQKRVPIVFNGVNPDIAAMWQSLDEDKIQRLKQLSNIVPSGLLSASTNFSEGRMQEQGGLDHYIGVATTLPSPEDFASLEVPALTWAVFESIGPFPETLQNIWGRIYSEWLPSFDYELAPGPEILWNENKDVTSPTYHSEIWIPVTQRQSR